MSPILLWQLNECNDIMASHFTVVQINYHIQNQLTLQLISRYFRYGVPLKPKLTRLNRYHQTQLNLGLVLGLGILVRDRVRLRVRLGIGLG